MCKVWFTDKSWTTKCIGLTSIIARGAVGGDYMYCGSWVGTADKDIDTREVVARRALNQLSLIRKSTLTHNQAAAAYCSSRGCATLRMQSMDDDDNLINN